MPTKVKLAKVWPAQSVRQRWGPRAFRNRTLLRLRRHFAVKEVAVKYLSSLAKRHWEIVFACRMMHLTNYSVNKQLSSQQNNSVCRVFISPRVGSYLSNLRNPAFVQNLDGQGEEDTSLTHYRRQVSGFVAAGQGRCSCWWHRTAKGLKMEMASAGPFSFDSFEVYFGLIFDAYRIRKCWNVLRSLKELRSRPYPVAVSFWWELPINQTLPGHFARNVT